MGRLGWSPPVAMAADVNAILLAWDGREEADYELQATILRAAGVKVAPRKPSVPDPADVADKLRAMASRINAARAPKQNPVAKPPS